MSKIAIALAHGHTAKWLQVFLSSLRRFNNKHTARVFIACTWPGHPSIRAGRDTPLGEGITFLDCKRRLHSHSTGLEEILEHIWDDGYEYLFTCETDCAAQSDGWLDWFVEQAQRGDTRERANGVTGFFWHEGRNHHNINPSGTLYRVDMLKQYHNEARANKDPIFWHPKGNKHATDGGMDPSVCDWAGVFSETRGIPNLELTEEQAHCIEWGVPQAAWWEPGQWVYVRSRPEWGEVRLPCTHEYVDTGVVKTPEGTVYGTKADPKFIHYWGGTRAYDFLKHPVTCGFVKGGAPWWLQREDRIWREFVDPAHREIVHKLNLEAEMERKMRENLGVFIPEAM